MLGLRVIDLNLCSDPQKTFVESEYYAWTLCDVFVVYMNAYERRIFRKIITLYTVS